jgi:hypothetical protein
MTQAPNPPVSTVGMVIVLAASILVGLAVFLPLFLWLPIYSPWRYAVWAAAVVGPLGGASLGHWFVRRRGGEIKLETAQQVVFAVVFIFLIASILPYLTRT